MIGVTSRWAGLCVGIAGGLCSAGAMAEDAIPEISVTARRMAPAASEPVFSTTVIDQAALDQYGIGRLDTVLRDIPGFSLFRRQSSQASHPTTQGVTLRGLGPSGAGRTLLLLDGVPQNDPFGGWIDWSRLPPGALDSVAVTRGGGAGPWGNAALAGTIRLQSRVESGTGAEGEIGGSTFGAGDGRLAAHGDLGRAHLTLGAAGHFGDGPYLIRADQRGPVDQRTNDRGGVIRGGISVPIDDETSATLTGSTSSDTFINGIAIAKSVSQVTDGALSVVHAVGADRIGWETHIYGRKGNLPAVFSSVGAGRAVVTPSLNQFHVPSSAVGGNGLIRVPVTSTLVIDSGADIRSVDGSTNEQFQYVAPAFTRVRTAGGSELITGAFSEATWMPRPTVTLTASARFDYWQLTDGIRHETMIATGAVLRDDHYPTRDGTKGNFRLGGKFDVTDTVTLRAAAYSGFRVPTLNELYRPFRVGNVITEANPTLKPESLDGLETSATWRATSKLSTTATFFLARIDHTVGNVTIQTTPGLNAMLGVVVPAGGSLQQRQNIDRVRSEGVELEVKWAVTSTFDLTARYLYTDPKVTKNAAGPSLVGLQLPEVANHQAMLEAVWEPRQGTLFKLSGHASSGQFDDDQNTRRLKGYVTSDIYAEQALNDSVVLFISGDNLFDRTIEAGKAPDGTVTVGMPRVFSTGIRWRL
ncbi:MAG: TonB-dependent receptor [Rhodospirillaceae bacterium]|nr:MAG: TonB-dependent receptor [Rhodospirillaceae bacterium]